MCFFILIGLNQLTPKKQIAMIKSTQKNISGIAAAIFLMVIAFVLLPAFWFWVSFEIVSALLVSIGCGGEWYLHPHPAGRKKVEKDEHHKLESRFIGAVVLGVTMEIFAVGHMIREGVKLDDKVSLAESRADEVSKKLLLAEDVIGELNPRKLSPENRATLVSIGKLFVGQRLEVVLNGDSQECQSLSEKISNSLTEAGWIVTNGGVLSRSPNRRGIFINVNVGDPKTIVGATIDDPADIETFNANRARFIADVANRARLNAANAADAISKTLESFGFTNYLRFDPDGSPIPIATNSIRIYVGPRPRRFPM